MAQEWSPQREARFREKTEELRQAHESGMSRNAIARSLHITPRDVDDFSKRLGLVFDRRTTAAATEATRIDNAALRAELEAAALEDALRLRQAIWEPYGLYHQGAYVEEAPEPPAQEKLRLQQASESAARVARDLASLNAGADYAGINLLVLIAKQLGLHDESGQ